MAVICIYKVKFQNSDCYMLKKRKYTIVFLGTDGSGKSTMINSITPVLENRYGLKVRYEHLRPNYFPSIAVALGRRSVDEEKRMSIVENPHNVKTSGLLGSIFRLLYYLADYTIGYLLKVAFTKNTLWLFDRYYFDFIMDPRRFRINMPMSILKFCEVLVPKADLIISLGSSPEIIFNRKPETSLEEVTRQTEYLRKLVEKKQNAVWVDTGISIDESVENLLAEIDKVLRKN